MKPIASSIIANLAERRLLQGEIDDRSLGGLIGSILKVRLLAIGIDQRINAAGLKADWYR